jgi:hydrogenase/urease accessory protein HupE
MTIRLKRSTAAVLIGLMGLLGGMAIGQVADAFSSGPSATASYTPPFERTLTKIDRTLSAISAKLGPATSLTSILEELEKIRGNTYGVCKETGGPATAYCHGAF